MRTLSYCCSVWEYECIIFIAICGLSRSILRSCPLSISTATVSSTAIALLRRGLPEKAEMNPKKSPSPASFNALESMGERHTWATLPFFTRKTELLSSSPSIKMYVPFLNALPFCTGISPLNFNRIKILKKKIYFNRGG